MMAKYEISKSYKYKVGDIYEKVWNYYKEIYSELD
jgi:hypothetical protein